MSFARLAVVPYVASRAAHRYPGKPLFDAVSLRVEPRDRIALLGYYELVLVHVLLLLLLLLLLLRVHCCALRHRIALIVHDRIASL